MRAKLRAGDGVESPKNMPPMVAVKPDASDGQDAKLLTSAPQQILESDRKPVQVAAPQRPEMAAKPVGTAQPETRLASVQGEPADIAPLAAVAPERAAQTHLPPPPTQMPAQHVETARHVANQMAIAMTDRAGRATEISLNPEELGRVRLTMSAVDTAITLSISAERQETSDLLRRHIETLAQEFRDLGYDDITFSFGQRDNPQQGTADPSPSGREQPAEDDDLGMLRPTKIASASGLDIKV